MAEHRIIVKINRKIFSIKIIEVRRIHKTRLIGRQDIDDIRMRKRRKRNDIFDEDGMSDTTGKTDDSHDPDLESAVKKINITKIRSMKSPIMMLAGSTDNGVKINGIDNINISYLI